MPETAGVFCPSNVAFYLENRNEDGPAVIAARFGQAGDLPPVGAWCPRGGYIGPAVAGRARPHGDRLGEPPGGPRAIATSPRHGVAS